uniref:(northern house mosquito) hypothetical protein n=1 Tax=Culex pipiens TaxID=7175 RepID=A0A8D8NH83_CULPI
MGCGGGMKEVVGVWAIKLLLPNIFVVPAGGGAKFHRSKSRVFPPPLCGCSFVAVLEPVLLALVDDVMVEEFALNSPLATLAAGTIRVGVSDFFRLDLDSVFSGVTGTVRSGGGGEMILGCCKFFTIVIGSLLRSCGCDRSFVLLPSQ